MFPAKMSLFSLLGFRVNIDPSWFLIAVYLVVVLSTRYFPGVLPHLDGLTYAILGIVGAAGLFGSIILHEFAHAIVARWFGLPIGGITLFIFGGVAELRQEPATPRAEFWVAIAGPVSSILIALVFFLSSKAGLASGFTAVATFLATTNTVLALFNLVPAFPLDGGRVLRAILWWRTGNFRRATRIAAAFGSAFGFLLMAGGVFELVAGNAAIGIWWLLIGIFLAFAASQSKGQSELATGLQGVTVSQLMNSAPLTITPDATLEALMNDYVYRHNQKFVIVAEDDVAFGFIGPRQIKQVPPSEWARAYVRTIYAPFSHDMVVDPSTPAVDAFRKLRANGLGYLAVLDGKRPVGTLTNVDFANFLHVREEFSASAKP